MQVDSNLQMLTSFKVTTSEGANIANDYENKN